MEQNNKLVIRTSGFALYFFLLMMALGILMLYFVTKDTVLNGVSLAKLFIIILFCWFEIFAYKFIMDQKMEVGDGEFSAQFGLPTRKLMLFPKFNKVKVKLEDIKSVTIARIKYFEEHPENFENDNLKEVISVYRNLFTAVVNRGIIIPIPLGPATKYTPLMYIELKNSSQEKGIVITTKPFSKNGFRKLIQEFKKQNVAVMAEPALGLQ